ncbi:MAG: hypothetical protein M1839_005263 [Geoglossum umbratile]|nr:MAG: hypothetical protein M1839_005263 [Geoglossum umbratile]
MRFTRFLRKGKLNNGQDIQPSPPLVPESDSLPASATLTEGPPFGLKLLVEGTNPLVDIIAVHGLNGHREKTWTASNGVCWLRQLMPAKIPNARIFTWGYDASTHSISPISAQSLYDHATTLVSDLCLERRLSQTEKRPIIFVAHSLGGIVVKSALIHSDSARERHLEHHRSIKLSTHGIFFLGTPHQGGEGVSWAKILVNAASIFAQSNTHVLRHLERDSEWLQQQLGQYAPISGEFVTKFAFETYETPLPFGGSIMVVPKSSAVVPGAVNAELVAIMANHTEMVRYRSADDEGFKKVSGHLQLMVQDLRSKMEDGSRSGPVSLERATVTAADARSLDNTIPAVPHYSHPMPALGHKDPIPGDFVGCLRELSFPGIDNRKDSILAAHPTTFHWIQANKELNDWLRLRRGLFWIQGKPGSGKSTITKHLYELSKSTPAALRGSSFIIAFFFNTRGATLEKSMDGLLRSCLIQVLKQHPRLFSHIQEPYLRMDKDHQGWSSIDLKPILKAIVTDCVSTHDLSIFIDALDECEGPPGALLTYLFELAAVTSTSRFNVQICVSSRPLPTFVARLANSTTLILQHHTLEDISAYVTAKLGHLASDSEGKVFQEFQSEIIHKSNGVFLWVTLVVEELLLGWEEADTISELRRKLSGIPNDLYDFFKRMVWRINRGHVDDAIAMIKCVLSAAQPLSVAEFRLALAFGSAQTFRSMIELNSSEDVVHSDNEMVRRIRSRCGGLLEVPEAQQIVQFIHQTVIDFLLTPDCFDGFAPSRGVITYAQGHQYLLRACLQYLSITDLKSSSNPNHAFDFLNYSMHYWVDHYRGAEQDGESQHYQIQDLADPTDHHFQTWYRRYCDFQCEDAEIPPIVVFAAEHNLMGYMREVLKDSANVGTEGGEFGFPLQAAAVAGNVEMVRLLLDHGADINARGGRFGTAMAAAITLHKEEVISLLLERGADVTLAPPMSPVGHRSGSRNWAGHRSLFSRDRAERAVRKDLTGVPVYGNLSVHVSEILQERQQAEFRAARSDAVGVGFGVEMDDDALFPIPRETERESRSNR